MSKTRVVNIRDKECVNPDGTWREGYVYIGRANKKWKLIASPFGNPFKPISFKKRMNCLEAYRKHIEAFLETSSPDSARYLRLLKGLKGKVLMCWCKPEPCHGDVLVELIEKYFPDEGDAV